MRGFSRRLVVLAGVLLVPSVAFAQASLSGLVKDTSGAVLPGVTVEASSPVLIEKVRTAVTDGSGQYQITELRPGSYTVTFTLPGFNTVKREGVTLTGSGITSVDAELRVGALEETITVTGEAPTVDVQSTTRQQVLTNEVINALPTGRNYQSLGTLIAGVNTNNMDMGGAMGDTMASLTIHGSRNVDQRVLQNGVNTMTLQAGGNIGIAVPNPAMAAEVTIDTASVSAEQPMSGVRINYIPRDGGNSMGGTSFFSIATAGMQGDNFSDELRSRGLATPNSIKRIIDLTPAFGGPIKKDRLWFYFASRYNLADLYAAGMYYNKNAYNPGAWTYEPDLSRPAYAIQDWEDAQIRFTSQVAPKHKVAFVWDQQFRCSCPHASPVSGVTATRSPEAAAYFRSPVQQLLHSEWSSPMTNRLLLEVVALHRTERWGNMHQLPGYRSTEVTAEQSRALAQIIPVTEQSTGLQYRSRNTFNNTWVPNYFYRFAASYVTGSHAFKAGFNDMFGYLDELQYTYHAPYEFRFNQGVPNQITLWARPYHIKTDQNHDFGVFAQDRWTINRFTLTLGVRFDNLRTSFPDQQVGPTELTPTRNITFPGGENLNWKDVTPRLGATYDLFGDGKTALKVSANKYLQAQTLNGIGRSPNPVTRLVESTTRSWTDANRNFVPECDLVSPVANGECGPLANNAFGVLSTGFITFDDILLRGWRNRGFNWEFSGGIQREILPRVAVDVGYFRRLYGNFQITDNRAVEASDFDQFSMVIPAGLPNAGKTVTGLFDVRPAKFGQNVSNSTISRVFGTEIQHWDGFDLNMSMRLQGGAVLSGGLSSGKTTLDNCEVGKNVPEALVLGDPNTGAPIGGPPVRLPLEWCHRASPMLTQVKFLGAYTIPRVDVQVSGTLQSIPGPEIRADYNLSTALAATSLGRPLAGGAANQTVAAIKPLSMYGDRLNQVDVRLAKIFRFGTTRTALNVDIFNLFNVNTVITENPNAGAFRRPTGIVLARFLKIGATFDF
jgi:hypothetical protein